MTQAEAMDILKMGHNCYITGAAGSGKTHLLNEYIKFLRNKGVEVGITASTGIAATHIGGTTIHSWSGLGIRDSVSHYDLEALYEKKYLRDRFKSTKVLIIDEISMLHHFRLGLVDQIVRHFTQIDLPFGGMQVILCGDFFQLPPISKNEDFETLFSFDSDVWNELDLKICYLEEQHRQKDDVLLRVLNDIRNNTVCEDTMCHLRARYNKEPQCEIEPTKLHTHNANVDSINDTELDKINGEYREYRMISKGRAPLVELLKKSCLAPDNLKLKVGARVMFVKNNFEAGYVNGTLGKVVTLGYDGPTIRTVSGKIINVERASWMIEDEGKVKAKLEQFPLRLAWAITVHKSQGMSLDAVEVDLSKSFEKGMGYVALSRVRSLSGLKLLGLNKIALEVHGGVFEFDKKLREKSEMDREDLVCLEADEIKEKQNKFLEKIAPAGFVPGKKKEKKMSAKDSIRNMLKDEAGLSDIAKVRGVKIATILDHIEKILEEEPDFNIDHLKKEISTAKFKDIYMAFKNLYSENRDYLLSPVKNKLGSKYNFEDIRLVRLFVKRM